MGISVTPVRVEYSARDIFHAISDDIDRRKEEIKAQSILGAASPAESIIDRNKKALSILTKWIDAGKDTLVTQFVVPAEPRLGGDPSNDVVSQILDKKMKPKGVRLER